MKVAKDQQHWAGKLHSSSFIIQIVSLHPGANWGPVRNLSTTGADIAAAIYSLRVSECVPGSNEQGDDDVKRFETAFAVESAI